MVFLSKTILVSQHQKTIRNIYAMHYPKYLWLLKWLMFVINKLTVLLYSTLHYPLRHSFSPWISTAGHRSHAPVYTMLSDTNG